MPSPQAEPPEPERQVSLTDEPKPKELLLWTAFGIALTAVLSFWVLTFFVRLIAGQGSWWKVGSHHLADGQWFEAARVTVALMALTVAGGAAYLAYRRQRTADENQKTAAKTQLITADAYLLSTQQHVSTLRRELRTRFTDAAAQLAHSSAAVRIAGIYAMAALADDWHSQNEPNEVQTCIDVLCGYLRLPYDPEHAVSHQTKRVITRPRFDSDGAKSGEIEEHFEFRQNDREVRKTIVRVINDHLLAAASPSWSDRAFDFQGAILEDIDLSDALFHGQVSFSSAKFLGKKTIFNGAEFHGELTSFNGSRFDSELTSFSRAQFHSQQTLFNGSKFHSEETSFGRAQFRGERTSFNGAQFHGELTLFDKARFDSKRTWFEAATFDSKRTSFSWAQFHGERTCFNGAQFHGEQTSFDRAQFHGEDAWFVNAEFRNQRMSFTVVEFRGERISFEAATFDSKQTLFDRAQFHGERTSFDGAQFHGERTWFNGAQFRSELTSFTATGFHSKQTSFDFPRAWNRVYFDWDPRPPLALMGHKPSSVSPSVWPPFTISRNPVN